MGAYHEDYLPQVMKTQGRLFYIIRDELSGVDEKWFIEKFMRSHARAMMDEGNFKYICSPPKEMMMRFIEDELGGEYQRGESWWGFLPEWCGKVYALYQWKYDIKSKDLIELIPLSEIERVFPTLHQAGWEAAVDKLHDLVC